MWRLCLLLALFAAFACSCGSEDGPTATPISSQFQMEGASMEPTFSNGMLLEVVPYTAPVVDGDIVVFRAPTSPVRTFLKRVIAGPGEHVEITDDGRVLVNGKTLSEPYTQGTTGCFPAGGTCAFTIPPIDHPAVPDPSASPLSLPLSAGTFDTSVCQTTACYFVMGDNRQNSSDSRQGWLLPVQNIIGHVELHAAPL